MWLEYAMQCYAMICASGARSAVLGHAGLLWVETVGQVWVSAAGQAWLKNANGVDA